MNELNKLIEQLKYDIELEASDKGILADKSWGSQTGILLTVNEACLLIEAASRPTCGKEQRLFLDEVEKGEWYDTSDDDPEFITQGIMVGQETFLFRQDFRADLQKVLNGE